MTWLLSRALAGRIAFTALAAVLSPLALPAPATAAPTPTPSPKSEAAPADSGATLVDLGFLNTSGGDVGGINSKGEVAGNVAKEPGKAARAVLFTGGSFTDVHAAFGPDITYSRAWDVNDDGTVVGTVDGSRSFLFEKGKATLIEPKLARAVNNKGQVVGDARIRNADGSILKLQAFEGQHLEAYSLNDSGAVVGGADMNPDKTIKDYRAFRTRPGEPIDVNRDRLEYMGSTLANDINDHGQVAGYGTDAGGGYVPLIWDENGRFREMATPHGGMVDAINNAGTGVGRMYSSDGWLHAALFENGVGTYLRDLVPHAGWTLKKATDINDLGQITGVGSPPGSTADHAFLIQLGSTPVITSMTLQTQLYPFSEWEDVTSAGATVDGNPVRVTVSMFNPGSHPVAAQLQLTESSTDVPVPLPGGKIDKVLAPRETVTEQVTWDTAGFAWRKDWPNRKPSVEAKLVVGDAVQASRRESLTIRPKPVVLVHGYNSDAQAWKNYRQFLEYTGGYLRGYAVGDGQVPGTLNTGSLTNPIPPTLTIEQNAEQEALYIEGVRKQTGAFHVDVVAHSMGGLITRQYIQTRMPNAPDGRPVVNRMLQMGTPNRGSPCADMALDLALWLKIPVPWPATQQLTVPYVSEVFNPKVTDLKGVTASNLVGVGQGVPCYTLEDGDGVVPESSAQFTYTDIPYTQVPHTEMTDSEKDYASYVKPRLGSLLVDTGNPGGEPARKDAAARPSEKAATRPGRKTAARPGRKTAAEAAAETGPGTASTFATPSATVEAGKTATVPLDVPQGTGFGVTGALPSTVGLLLRDPAGQPAASYTAGSASAKQPFQGLSVPTPTAGAWKLEITNTGTAPVTAALAAWITGNPVTATAKARQASEDGTAQVTATVADDGEPVTGATVKAILIAEDATRHELTLKDDGNSDDGAAGDGTYGATTGPLADGVYSVAVKADTTKGTRTARDAVTIRKVDTREFELKLSATPGGSVTASPAQEKYRAGTKVTLTATPEEGRIPIGWVIDGKERGAGALTVVMDGEHSVQARFGTYAVTEIGTLPGYDVEKTKAVALNDRGQVAATVKSDKPVDGRPVTRARAVRWQAGEVTDLGGLPCEGSGDAHCNSAATGINEAGDVSGWSNTWVDGALRQHAVVYRDGSVTDLQPASLPSDTDSAAVDLNDDDQVFGWMDQDGTGFSHAMWNQGKVTRISDPKQFMARDELAGRINARGAVAGAYDKGLDAGGVPTGEDPAVYQDGVTTKLEIPKCLHTSGTALDINDTGLVVGEGNCRTDDTNSSWSRHAYTWQDGRRTDLGEGRASAVNDHGLVAGLTGPPHAPVPALWLDGRHYELEDLLPRPACDITTWIKPCMTLTSLLDVNSSGQILAQGFIYDDAVHGGIKEERSFLLTPTTAQADLEVTHTVSKAKPWPGATVTWTATATNHGPDPATGVRLDVVVPPAAGEAVCETSQGTCSEHGASHQGVIGSLAAGATATVTVTATIPAGTADGTGLTSEAKVSTLEGGDPKPGNNTAQVTATVKHSLDKTAINWADPVRAGATSKYPMEVTLTNRSGEDMPLTDIKTEGPFTQTNACPAKLGPGEVCTVQLWFAPTRVGPAGGKLTFTTGGTAPSHTVTLTGQGIEANAEPVVELPAAPLRGTVGEPFTLTVKFTDTDAADTHTASVEWGDGSSDKGQVTQAAGGGTVTATRTFDKPVDEGYALVEVKDSKGDTGWKSVPYVIKEATPGTAPVVITGPDVEVTVGETLRRVVSFADPDSTSWTATVDYGDGTSPAPITPDGKEITLEHRWAAAGKYSVIVTVRDDGGLQTTAAFSVTVLPAETPNQAPQVKLTGPGDVTEGTAWSGEASFTDPDTGTWTATADYGDGPEPLPLDGKRLKLEHTFTDNGDRTVTVTVTDDKGATGTAELAVRVANAAPRVSLDEPAAAAVVAVGTPLTLSASFTDPGVSDTHTAVWTVGTQQVTGAVTGRDGKGTATSPHVFTRAGRYPISVTVTDDDGTATVADTVGGEKAYVLVYDPAGSLVGAGAVASPAGSCRLTAACGKAGSAAFVVTASYPRKATAPTGGLRYDASGFKLRDTSYTVLTAAGGTAVLRGEGRVNGTVDVTFEVTAVDSGKPLGRDRLRLRVWRKDGELVYDNQPTGSAPSVTGVVRVSGRD
ncbi:putative repeat protein (TIGR01451 family) [Streptosporangium becharense]|uniref:Putative repeat protein (TIGR01451 family) n=1 Tax=Streptosporangium becharense TaxID=1816182 RepID=A0A7W9IKP0_9ACTN|nr:PKD domain-containing protein [Streptosporangium becharense]MBB2911740.1 putative repeat protein (TIGR01451 family) [Streptosporangium becharense]MBB5822442.1 putative repeat protein (TIGR01451 family) [Streptosporangium becharense]